MGHCIPKVRPHLAIQQVCVFLAEHLLVILEDAVAGPGAHEVEVAEAGGEAAAHRSTRLQAELTALRTEGVAKRGSQGLTPSIAVLRLPWAPAEPSTSQNNGTFPPHQWHPGPGTHQNKCRLLETAVARRRRTGAKVSSHCSNVEPVLLH